MDRQKMIQYLKNILKAKKTRDVANKCKALGYENYTATKGKQKTKHLPLDQYHLYFFRK
jgi:hypothetical protein